jgi:hypothetical protein
MNVKAKLLETNDSSSSETQKLIDSTFNINRTLHIHLLIFNFAATCHNEGYNK